MRTILEPLLLSLAVLVVAILALMFVRDSILAVLQAVLAGLPR